MEHVDPNIEAFDRYLLGLMDTSEQEAFERRLENDPDLRKAFGMHKAMVEGIQQHRKTELKNYLKEHTHVKSATRIHLRWMYVAAAAVVALFAVMYVLVQNVDDYSEKVVHKEESPLTHSADSIETDNTTRTAPSVTPAPEENKGSAENYTYKEQEKGKEKTEDGEIINNEIAKAEEDMDAGSTESVSPEITVNNIPQKAIVMDDEEPVQVITEGYSKSERIQAQEEKVIKDTRKKNRFLESEKHSITTEFYKLEEENDMLYQYDGKVLKLYNVNKDEKVYYSTVNNKQYITFGKITYEIQLTATPVKLVPSDLKLDY